MIQFLPNTLGEIPGIDTSNFSQAGLPEGGLRLMVPGTVRGVDPLARAPIGTEEP